MMQWTGWCWVAQVGVQAYLLWERAGKPDGADFSKDARQTLERQLASGTSVQDLERSLKAPSPAPVQEAAPPPHKVCLAYQCLQSAAAIAPDEGQ